MITAAFEAPTVVAGFNDIAMVGQGVEQRGGHLGIAEHARPFAEGEVGISNRVSPNICFATHKSRLVKNSVANEPLRSGPEH